MNQQTVFGSLGDNGWTELAAGNQSFAREHGELGFRVRLARVTTRTAIQKKRSNFEFKERLSLGGIIRTEGGHYQQDGNDRE
jgi:hypothetical protein